LESPSPSGQRSCFFRHRFTFLTIAAALATTVSTWLALLITTGILLLFVLALGQSGS